jgi:hypothetical protein
MEIANLKQVNQIDSLQQDISQLTDEFEDLK